MKTKHKYWGYGLVGLGVILAAGWYLHRHYVAVFQPRGTLGHQERNLILIGLLLAVIVVVPVYALTIGIAWKYRAGNAKAHYSPDWDHGRLLELTWWAIPGVIILALSVIAWQSAHALDPFKPLGSLDTPINIQVVSLDWKWLFIYPKQGIASVNFVEFPANVPINFDITSDTVMDSFWIPALGGQIYSMPGMSTQMHALADQTGSFSGSSANISGRGFAGMTFTAKAVSYDQFNSWVTAIQKSPQPLTDIAYYRLAEPSQNNPPAYYSHVQNNLFNDIVMKYHSPIQTMPGDYIE